MASNRSATVHLVWKFKVVLAVLCCIFDRRRRVRLKTCPTLPLSENLKDHAPHHALHATLALLLATATGAVRAHETQLRFAVTATVSPVVRIEAQSAPRALELSATDIAQGYVDVIEPVRVRVHSNGPGYALELVTVAPLISAMIITGAGGEQRLGGEGGTWVERWAPASMPRSDTAETVMHFRLILAPNLAAGRYPWPLRLLVRPLENRN